MFRRPALVLLALVLGCSHLATNRGDTVVFASGADLQSINPLLTTHPLAHQVQRYVLLTTLVRYDSALNILPYLARAWEWSADSTVVTMHLVADLKWHDGKPTDARDVAWTLDAARDPATGYSRQDDLAQLASAIARDDSTITLTFRSAQHALPDVLTDLAILPAHLLDSVPHAALRAASWNLTPVGNGPFRFVSHQQNRRWVFERNLAFPHDLGGPASIERLVIAVVDEPTTKLAALTSGELDFAGINPAHATFVAKDPHLTVVRYPLLFTYVIAFNVRRPPFNEIETRRRIARSIDRAAIVQGYLFGFGTPASGPRPEDSLVPRSAVPTGKDASGTPPISFELLTVGSGEAALEQMIQSQLSAAGVRASIRQLELSAFLARVQGPSPDFDAAVIGIPGDLGLGQLGPILRTAGFTPPRTTDGMLQMVFDSLPAAFIYHAGGVQGMNRRMQGVHMDLRGELATLHDWRVIQ